VAVSAEHSFLSEISCSRQEVSIQAIDKRVLTNKMTGEFEVESNRTGKNGSRTFGNTCDKRIFQ
jgi:hypothetical protein